MWYRNAKALVNLNKFVSIRIEKLGNYVIWGKLPDTYTQIIIDRFDTEEKAEKCLINIQKALAGM
ncbi:MAG: hypothetical protein ACOC80_09350 [Petrotogales bacterium]